jgi:hypothetical protein
MQIMRRNVVSTLVVFSALAPSAWATTLVGRITSDQISPVGGEVVSIQATVISTSTVATYRVLTDAQGKFSIAIPNPGTYSVCVGSRTRFLLNSCEWALSQSLVTIAPGQATAKFNLALKTGVVINIRLNDPGQLLPQPGAAAVSKASAAVQFSAFAADGSHHLATQVSTDPGGQNLELLIPLSTSIHLGAQAANAQVLDQTQSVVGPSSVTISSNAGSIPPVLVYQVAAVAVSPGKANAQK